MKVVAVANPVSGSGKALQYLEDLVTLSPIDITTVVMPSAVQAQKRLEDLIASGNISDVIAIGGDGLIHLCIQALQSRNVRLHVLPAGTGNDFANSHFQNRASVESIIESLIRPGQKLVDLGEISFGKSKKFFGQVLSSGFDAVVNERANRIRFIRGQMKYNIATLLVLARFKPISYKIEVDGEVRELKAMLISIANGPTYGGGMKIVPMAVPSDGALDVIVIHPVSRFELLKVFPKVFSGSHVGHPKIEFLKAKKIRLEAETVSFADGEFISHLPISIDVKPNALTLAD